MAGLALVRLAGASWPVSLVRLGPVARGVHSFGCPPLGPAFPLSVEEGGVFSVCLDLQGVRGWVDGVCE